MIDETDWVAYAGPEELGYKPHGVRLALPVIPPVTYCPGYLTSAASVHEAYIAYDAKHDGCLEAYFPDLEMIVLEAALVAGDALRTFENSEHRKHQLAVERAKR